MVPWEVLLQTVHQLKGAPICLRHRGHCCKLFYECQKTIRRWKETTFHGESTPIIAKLLSLKVCWNLVVIMKILLKLWNSVKVVKFCQSCGVLSDLYGLVWSGRPNNEQWIGHNSQRSRWEWHLPWGWSFSTQLCHQTFVLLIQLKQRRLKHVKNLNLKYARVHSQFNSKDTGTWPTCPGAPHLSGGTIPGPVPGGTWCPGLPTIQSPVVCPAPPHLCRFLSRTKDMMLLSTPKYIKLTLCKQCCWWRLVCPGTAKTDGPSHHNSCTAATEWYF